MALGFESTVYRLEEGHQLPDAGNGMLAQKRELALPGDLIRTASFLQRPKAGEVTLASTPAAGTACSQLVHPSKKTRDGRYNYPKL